jgi:hypothetical protein
MVAVQQCLLNGGGPDPNTRKKRNTFLRLTTMLVAHI